MGVEESVRYTAKVSPAVSAAAATAITFGGGLYERSLLLFKAQIGWIISTCFAATIVRMVKHTAMHARVMNSAPGTKLVHKRELLKSCAHNRVQS